MTQRISFTKERVIEAAFALTREGGWGAVTARTIATRLGSSTMPIYSSLSSMEEIEGEVRRRTESLMRDFQQRPYAKEQPLDIALGYVTFARDERNLFRFLYVDRPVTNTPAVSARRGPGARRKNGSGRSMLSIAEHVPQDPRILKSWIFTHGLASMLSSGVLDLPDKRIRSLLREAGGAFFASEARVKKGARNRKKEQRNG
jgi:AcrR family transcriptional regulator